MQEMQVQLLGQEDTLEEEMATHSSILAWETPWTEKPGGLQSLGSQRVQHDLLTEWHHHDQVGFLLGMQGFFYISNQCGTPHHKLRNKNQMIIWIDAEKAFDKIQHLFMINTLQKVGIKGNHLST